MRRWGQDGLEVREFHDEAFVVKVLNSIADEEAQQALTVFCVQMGELDAHTRFPLVNQVNDLAAGFEKLAGIIYEHLQIEG